MLRSALLTVAMIAALALSQPAEADSAPIKERHSDTAVAETVESFLSLLEQKGATVFSVVDHAAGAAKVDMDLAPATLVIFGNPKLGTPLMQTAPELGIVLPMKALFLADGEGGTRVLYTDIVAEAAHYGVGSDNTAVARVSKVLDNLIGAVAEHGS